MKAKYYYLINLFILISLSFLLYNQVVGYEYVWDDFILFVYNTSLSEQNFSWELISRPVIEGSAYFRPLVFYTWYLEFNLLEQSPAISHFFNIIIFSFNAWLTFLLANNFLKKYSSYLPTLVLVFYVCNPILIESTAWISGRFDLMVTFFILLAIHIYFNENIHKYLKQFLVSFLFFCALLSKELAIIFPVLLFFCWAYQNGIKLFDFKKYLLFVKENIILLFLIGFFTVFYFILRYNALGVIGSTTFNATNSSIVFNDLLPIQAFNFYIKNYILPLTYVVGIHPIAWDLNISQKINLFFSFFSFVFILLVFVVKNIKEIWLMFATLLTVSLVLYLIPFTNGASVGNMRFMTLGLSFYAILFVKLLFDLYSFIKKQKNKKTALSLTTLIYVFILGLMLQNFNHSIKVWKNDLSLWKTTYLMNPNYNVTRFNYLNSLVDLGQYEEAKAIIEKNNQSLAADEQALYALILINLNDSEGMLYYQGLAESLPKYHLDFKSYKDINPLLVYAQTNLTTQNLSIIYSSYAMSLLLMNNDIEKARYYFKLSRWYHNPELATISPYDQFIVEYLLGNSYKAIADLKIHPKKFNYTEYKKIFNFIDRYCTKFKENKNCLNWEQDKKNI